MTEIAAPDPAAPDSAIPHPVAPAPATAVWATPAEGRAGRPLLVLLHGYGADERDLLPLAESLPSAFAVVSVRAPLTLPWPAPGYAWFPLDGPAAQASDAAGAAASGLLSWLDATATCHPATGLLGFSQGGAVALQAMRLAPQRFAFAVSLSGFAVPGELPGDAELAARRPPVFWGRGARDQVIPPSLIGHTAQWLPGHVQLRGRVYPGLTHSISDQEITDVRAFLEPHARGPWG